MTIASRSRTCDSSAYSRIGCSGPRSSARSAASAIASGGLLLAQRRDPALGHRRVGGDVRAQCTQRRRQRPVQLRGGRPRMDALGLCAVDDDDLGVLAERAAEAEPEVHRHADDERDVGALQRRRTHAREGEPVVGGHAPAREAVEEHRDAERLDELEQRVLAVPPPQVAARHDDRPLGLRQQRERAPQLVGVGLAAALAARQHGRLAVVGPLGEHVVEREVDERRPARRAQRRGERLVDECRDLPRRLGRGGEPRQRPHERQVIDLLQRALPPAPRRRATAEHDHRRVALQRRPHRAHPVRDAGSGGQRRHAGPPRDLRPALGRERRGRLVARVDERDALGAAAVVDREEVPAREREDGVDALRAQPARGEQAAVGGRDLVLGRHQPGLSPLGALAVDAVHHPGREAREVHERMELDPVALALQLHGAARQDALRLVEEPSRRLGDEDVVAGLARDALDARRGVHHVADDRELQTPAAADGARDDRPRVHADADGERVPEALAHDRGDLARGRHAPLGMPAERLGSAEHGQQPVADVLVDVAAVVLEHGHDAVEQLVEPARPPRAVRSSRRSR